MLKRFGFHISTITLDQSSIDYAIKENIIDEGSIELDERMIGEADLVIFALYPHVFVEWIEKNQGLLKSGALITDVTGVKRSIVYQIQDMLRLSQVCLVHNNGRSDIFKAGTKYSEEELKILLKDESRPILVSVDEKDEVMGYCFCIFQQHVNNSVLTDIKTLYIDDLCVDEVLRGKHIGKELYEAAVKLAKESGCYNITLNVWSCNPSAIKFYEAQGLLPQKITMELIL